MKHHLSRHVKAIHEELKFPCHQCEYKATDKGSKVQIVAFGITIDQFMKVFNIHAMNVISKQNQRAF